MTGRRAEIAGAKDPEDQELLGYFKEGTEQASSEKPMDYVGVLDAILGTQVEKKEDQ